ncbi:helix-turn-helix domain-containing protein [Streptomyces roseus]
MAEPVRVRRLTDQEGQRLQQIARRGSTSSVRYRRAMMLLASAGGNRVPVIAQLVQADEDTVRDVIHRFNEIGPACLDPRWAGGRPHLLSTDDEDFVIQTATTRPAKLAQPFTRWSLRKLAAYLRKVHGRTIRIGREALRRLLCRRGITFQRTKTWKESPDPDREVKLDRIEEVLDRFPDRVFAFDEFGPLGIRPTAGSGWAGQGHPNRLPATYHRTHGVRYFHGCYCVGDDRLWGDDQRIARAPLLPGLQFAAQFREPVAAHGHTDVGEPVLILFLDVMADLLHQHGNLRLEALVAPAPCP